MNPPAIYIEISQTTLKALKNGDGFELPLEREANGRLTARGKENLIAALRTFLKKKAWQPKNPGRIARLPQMVSPSGACLFRSQIPNRISFACSGCNWKPNFRSPPPSWPGGWRLLGGGPA